MSVLIGEVETFDELRPDKAQALKVLEEAAEVLAAWQLAREDFIMRDAMLDECADVVQAVANLVAAYGVTDFRSYVDACRCRNERRGRL